MSAATPTGSRPDETAIVKLDDGSGEEIFQSACCGASLPTENHGGSSVVVCADCGAVAGTPMQLLGMTPTR